MTCILVAWLAFAQTAQLASGTAVGHEDTTRKRLVRQVKLTIDAGGYTSKPQRTATTPPFSPCPRDNVEKRACEKEVPGMSVRLSQEQRHKVDQAAASVHIAQAGA